MKTTKIVMIFVTGFTLGILVTLKLFGISDIDILGFPYKNISIVLKEPLQVAQNKTTLTLPRGTEMILHYGNYEIGYKVFLPLSFQGDVIGGIFSYEKNQHESRPFTIPEKANSMK